MLKKRGLSPVMKQSIYGSNDIWEMLLEHEDYDENCEYVCNIEFNEKEGVYQIIYKIV